MILVTVDLPSVAQTNIFAVGCVANATGVDGWEISGILYDSGRMWLVEYHPGVALLNAVIPA